MSALPYSTNPRQFFNRYAGRIVYVQADESILQDLDTPEDYRSQVHSALANSTILCYFVSHETAHT